jgi:very-short-patch-repair endonuclease
MVNKIIPYRNDLKAKARMLRKNSTLSEVLLWERLKRKQIRGYQFHRQVPLLDYIVDFYCHELKLVIEIDGTSHLFQSVETNDIIRQERIDRYGIHFLRFQDLEVKQKIAEVVSMIENWIDNYEDEAGAL